MPFTEADFAEPSSGSFTAADFEPEKLTDLEISHREPEGRGLEATARLAATALREAASPILGPTARQVERESVMVDGQPVYKPLGSEADRVGLVHALSKPFVDLPRMTPNAASALYAFSPMANVLPMRPGGTASKAAAGLANAGIGFAEFLESPLGLLTGGAGTALRGIASPAARATERAVAGGFSADMARGLPEGYTATREAIARGDVQGAVEAGAGTAASALLAGVAGTHAVRFPRQNRPPVIEQPPEALAAEADLAAKTPATEVSDAIPIREATEAPLEVTVETVPKAAESGAQPAIPPVEPSAKPASEPTTPSPGSESTTSIKDGVVEKERIERGESPLFKPETRGDEQVMAEAKAIEDADPLAAQKLIAQSPSHLRDFETALLLRERVRLKNEYTKAVNAGDHAATDIWSNKLTEMDLVVGHGGAGTQQGRDFRFRRHVMEDDFSLASLETKFKAAHDFRNPTVEERAELKQAADGFKAATEKAEREVASDRAAKREVELDRIVAEEKKAASEQKPTIHPDILSAAERVVRGMEADSAKAWERVKTNLSVVFESLSSLHAVPPESVQLKAMLADLGTIVSAKIARGAVKGARFTADMVLQFGEGIRPYADKLWDIGKATFDAKVAKGSPQNTERVKRAIQKVDAYEQMQDATDRIGAKMAGGENESVHAQVRKLVRAIVEADPKISREALVDWVHETLKGVDPEITRLEAMDAISGRGQFNVPPQDVVSKTVRDLNEQIRLVGHQIDVVAGNPLPKTGAQRDKMSNAARAELQRLNELKRQHGVNVTDPAAQLAGALQARKTYYTHRMADLRAEITSGERINKTKTAPPTDPALDALRAEYADVKAQHDAIFGDRTLTPEQRLKIATAAAERSAAMWAKRHEDALKGIFGGAKRPKPFTSPEIEAIKARRDALKDAVQELRDIANPKKTPEERQLQALKTRLSAKKARMLDQMARGDFSPKAKRPPPKMDRAATDALLEVEKIKESWGKRKADWEFEKLNRWQKAWQRSKATYRTMRDVMTAFDLPPVFRQGAFLSISQPRLAARSLGTALNSMRSDKVQFAVEQEIRGRENYPLYVRAKMFLAEHGADATNMEEAIRSTFSRHIPGVGASQRGYTTFLNKLRADSFDALLKTWFQGRNPTDVELKAIGNFINKATGRGDIGLSEGWSTAMSDIFFAPRNAISKFQLLLGQPFYRGNARTRLMVASMYGRFLMGAGVILGLAKMGGASIETDSNSSDFLKIKVGNRRIDAFGGLIQAAVFTSRFLSEKKTTAKGKKIELTGPNKRYGDQGIVGLSTDFLRSKLAPLPAAGVDYKEGENVVGEKVTALSAVSDMLWPMTWQDILESMKEDGAPEGRAMELLSLFGASLQTYDPYRKKEK